MADPTRVQTLTGESALATTTVSFSAATAGNLLVLTVASDAYKTGDPSGWTLPTGGAQQTFFGHYLWWRRATGGETSVAYTISVATVSAWALLEYNNVATSPYDTSNGQFTASSGSTYTTPAVTPSAGRRLAIATLGGSKAAPTGLSQASWLNSYAEVADKATTNTTGTVDNLAVAELVFDADGVATTSSGSTYTPDPEARTGITAVFKADESGPVWTYGYTVRIG